MFWSLVMTEQDLQSVMVFVDALVQDKVALRCCIGDERTWQILYERVEQSKRNLTARLKELQ
jgi:hypothetical protein